MPDRDSPTRRSFIKSVTGGAVAAAGLAAASPALAGTSALGTARSVGARRLRVAFSQGGATTLEDVHEALERALGATGCTRCGFDGIDLILRQEEILSPEPQPWIVTTWDGF